METPVQWEQRVPLDLLELLEEMPKARVPRVIPAKLVPKGSKVLSETPVRLVSKGQLAQLAKLV
jgi:hypothetical protein